MTSTHTSYCHDLLHLQPMYIVRNMSTSCQHVNFRSLANLSPIFSPYLVSTQKTHGSCYQSHFYQSYHLYLYNDSKLPSSSFPFFKVSLKSSDFSSSAPSQPVNVIFFLWCFILIPTKLMLENPEIQYCSTVTPLDFSYFFSQCHSPVSCLNS